MQLSRRQFNSLALLSTAFTSLGFAGCPAWLESVEAALVTYVPVLLQGFQSIVDLVLPGATAGIFDTAIALVKAAIADVQTAIADWQAADAAQKPGALGAIAAALEVVIKDIQAFLASVSVNAPKVSAIVTGLATIILRVLTYFANKLGGAPLSQFKMSNGVQIEPLKLSPSGFKKAFNARCVSLGVPASQIK